MGQVVVEIGTATFQRIGKEQTVRSSCSGTLVWSLSLWLTVVISVDSPARNKCGGGLSLSADLFWVVLTKRAVYVWLRAAALYARATCETESLACAFRASCSHWTWSQAIFVLAPGSRAVVKLGPVQSRKWHWFPFKFDWPGFCLFVLCNYYYYYLCVVVFCNYYYYYYLCFLFVFRSKRTLESDFPSLTRTHARVCKHTNHHKIMILFILLFFVSLSLPPPPPHLIPKTDLWRNNAHVSGGPLWLADYGLHLAGWEPVRLTFLGSLFWGNVDGGVWQHGNQLWQRSK